MGRPKKENTKTRGYRIRLTDEEYKQLKQFSTETNKSIADIIREGLGLLNDEQERIDICERKTDERRKEKL